MRRSLLLLLFINVFSGCGDITEIEDKTWQPDISFGVTSRLAEGKEISSLAVIDNENYYYSTGNQLFFVINGESGQLNAASNILAMAWNKRDNSLWLGTLSSGLARFKEGKITYFDQNSDHFPRNLVGDVVCDNNGVVWFNCSAHLLGGLGKYSNGKFLFFTPANSGLPDNLIKSIACLGQKVYVVTGGTVDNQKIVVIEGDRWKFIPVGGYYLMDMDVDRNGKIYIIDDVTLSSSFMTNKILLCENGECRNILPVNSRNDFWPRQLKTDLRNYLWVSKFGSEPGKNLSVYDGNKWHEVPSGFPEVSINCLAVDKNNTIWLGTDRGILLLGQQLNPRYKDQL